MHLGMIELVWLPCKSILIFDLTFSPKHSVLKEFND